MQSRAWTLWVAIGLATLAPALWYLGLTAAVAPLLGCSIVAASFYAGTRQHRGPAAVLAAHDHLPSVVIDSEHHILQANAAFSELAAVESKALVRSDIRAFLSESLWDQLNAEPTALISGSFRSAREHTHWVTLQLTAPATLSSGQRLLRSWDQTATYRQQSEQLEALQDLKGLLDSSHDIVLTLDQQGHILTANSRAQLVLGIVEPACHIAALVTAADSARIEQGLAGCAAAQGSIALRRLALKSLTRKQHIYIDARLHQTGFGQTITLTGSSINHMLAVENRLQESLDRLARVFEDSPDAIYITRRSDSKILENNRKFSQLLGYSDSVIAEQTEQSLGIWKAPAERQQAQQELLNAPDGVHCETRLVRADGSTFDAEISLRNITIDDAPCTLHCVRDVSIRKAADAAQAESEEKFLNTFQNSPDGIVILRKSDGLIYDINPTLVTASGYDRDFFIGQSLFLLNTQANLSDLDLSAEQLQAGKRFENIETTFRTRDGTELPALISAKEFEMRGETYLLTIIRDVRELRSAQARVARSEERFRGAFENAQLAMLLIDTDGRIFQSNQFAQDLLSYSGKELESLHISRLVPQEERINLRDTLSQMLQRGEQCVRSERRMQCHNGLEIWTNFQIVLQGDPTGEDPYFIIQAADTTDIKLSQRRMERMAFYDTLTDLANRRLFQDRLQQAIEHCQRSSHLSALLYLDLDQFKRVNDTLGHEAGDGLLREVALRLTECVRTEDTVGRPGGDEFTVLLFEVESAAAAGVVAEKILSSLQEPIVVSGHNLVVTTSIGIAVIPNDGRDTNVVMKNADLAMYRAKERGRNNYQFFSEDMNTRALLRLRTENELREGIARGEFFLHHQPKYRITDGKITGVECLVRWNHPTRGVLPPGEFIQIAEETGAIVDLGSWIIEASCQAGKAFSSVATDRFTTAVNISPRQFRDPNLISHIRRCLRSTGLPPSLLQIEITETMLMHDVEAASTIVGRLHELGIYLAIDDFGTGYSSLNYLKKFPIQTVKVDRSFVTDIPHNSDDMAITAAVIAMAHRLNMDVVAEGVETQGQLDFLADNDCEYAQGYLFSKPVSEEAIMAMLREEQAGATAPTPHRSLSNPLSKIAANSPKSDADTDSDSDAFAAGSRGRKETQNNG